MLTKVILEGPMGKAFGREWELAIDNPRDALRLIDANRPGVFQWIRDNLEKYAAYRIVIEYEDGKMEELDEEEYRVANAQPVSIRFVPLIEGAGAVGKMVLGVVLIVVGVYLGWTGAGAVWFKIGVSMLLSGICEALAPTPKRNSGRGEQSSRNDKTSYFFDGPVNTTAQGVPVAIIYGRVLTGSAAVSAAVSVDQLI